MVASQCIHVSDSLTKSRRGLKPKRVTPTKMISVRLVKICVPKIDIAEGVTLFPFANRCKAIDNHSMVYRFDNALPYCSAGAYERLEATVVTFGACGVYVCA